MERVTTKEAAKLLNMDVVTLQFLMRQERLPIGYAIKKDGKSRYHYIIYFADTVLNSMFLSYLEYRKENGKEVKGKAIGYCIDKLESLSNSPAEQVAIIKQTIQNGWTDFFPLKGKKEKVSGSNVSSWLEHEKMQSTGGVFGD